MKGDFTRSTFRPQKRYSGVRMQQGRVQLDADWNEQVDIHAHHRQTLARDVIGRCGVPRVGGGFQIAPTAQLTSVFFLDISTGWAVGADAAILATTDGGATWTMQQAPTGVMLNGVFFRDNNVGWAVGADATILTTNDGGATWTAQSPPPGVTAHLRGVFFRGADGWAVGDDTTILTTDDGGATWVERTPPVGVTAALNRIVLMDDNTGWAVGNGATLLATSDGGDTWTAQAAPTGVTSSLNGVAFASVNRGWAVGADATILTTSDGGANWTAQTPPDGVTAHLNDVAFANATTGWAVGDDATMLATVDGGSTWTSQNPPAESAFELHGLTFADSTHGWVVGDGATLLVTSDAGGTWASQTLPNELPSLGISAGRIYVDGLLCENEDLVSLTAQPDLPADNLADVVRPSGPVDAGTYLVYLDVWQRHITALEDPEIREVALGGADTTTRTKTICQVKLFRVGGPGISVDCSGDFPAWDAQVAASSGMLSARAEPDDTAVDPCIVPTGAGFRGLENQLYRVEIHTRGSLGNGATFKWSRENGSIATSWLDQNGNDLSVGRLTQNQLGFAAGQWVELTDETRELRGEPGTLVRLTQVDGSVLTIDPLTATGSTDRSAFSNTPKVRRWDTPNQTAGEIAVEDPGTNEGFISLESGIEVKFEAGSYSTGDYWLIPARTATADVEWPLDEESLTPMRKPSDGVEHRLCRLALVRFNDQRRWTLVDDCRCVFDSLTALPQLYYLSGDGQQARPGHSLCGPLVVRVASGCGLVPDATVRFQIVQPAGGGTGRLLLLEDRFDGRTPGAMIGLPWQQHAGQFVYSSDGQAQADASRVSVTTVSGVTRDDVVVEARVDASGVAADAGLVARYSGADDQNMYLGRLLGQNLEILVNVNGVLTQLATLQVPVNTGTLRFSVVNTSLQLTLITPSGSFPIQATDTTFVTGGLGLRGRNATFDNFRSATSVADQLDVTTDSNGQASCGWQLDDADPPNICQQVTATLVNPQLDLANQPLEPPIVFNAKLSIASEVAYTPPADCERFQGLQTVQQALDRLCEGEPVRIVRIYPAANTRVNLRNDSTITVSRLSAGVRLDCTDPIDVASIKRATCRVTIEVPQAGTVLTDYAPAVLAADLDVVADLAGNARQSIEWRPQPATMTWIEDQLNQAQGLGQRQLLAQLVIKGNFVWSSNDSNRFLDGDTFGAPATDGSTAPDGATATHLRGLVDGSGTGDNRRGGDFRMWFWVEPAPAARNTFPFNLALADVTVPRLWVSYSNSDPAQEDASLYDVRSGNEVQRIAGRLRGLTFGRSMGPGNQDVIFAMAQDGIRTYDSGGNLLGRLTDDFTDTAAMAVFPRGAILYVADLQVDAPRILTYDARSGRRLWEFPTSAPVTGMAFDSNGVEMWIASADAIRILDPFTGIERETVSSVDRPDQFRSLTIGEDDNVYISHSNAQADVHDILRLARATRQPPPGQNGVIFIPSDRNGGLNDPRDLAFARVDSRLQPPFAIRIPALYVASAATTGGVEGVFQYDGQGELVRIFERE